MATTTARTEALSLDSQSGFVVRVVDPSNSEVVREEFVTQPEYSYTMEKNQADAARRGKSPLRQFRLEVAARNRGVVGTFAKLTVQNVAPRALVNLSATSQFESMFIRYAKPTDEDFDGALVWRSTSAGFPLDDTTLVYRGRDNPIVIDAIKDTTYFWRAAAFDRFTDDPTLLNVSAEASLTTSTGNIEVGDLADGAVTTPKVADDAITQPKVGPLAIGPTELAALAVIAGKIANAGIDLASRFASGVVDSGALGSAAVIAGKLANGAIDLSSRFAAGVVDSGALGAVSVIAGKIATGGVSASGQFASGVVNTAATAVNAMSQLGSFTKTASFTLLNTNGGNETYGPLTITTDANGVVIPTVIFSIDYDSDWDAADGTTSNYTVEFRRRPSGGSDTILQTYVTDMKSTVPVATGTARSQINMPLLLDEPGAGTFEYRIKLIVNFAGGTTALSIQGVELRMRFTENKR